MLFKTKLAVFEHHLKPAALQKLRSRVCLMINAMVIYKHFDLQKQQLSPGKMKKSL